ncbi:ribonuclease P protein component [Christiangramia fulva]|uniref:Ribonuclease P protein component n=1 Tax=Christiangramia fulva TaxID=2126553 RepID=A0A2R3Z3I6_9FLAO|nr:ribonuclease P protein component [Christiangramia fulva]AVR44825.1 ribonuclease P protein component [Christiangramia fulva]
MNESFGKPEKLKSQKLIDELFLKGKSIKAFPLKLMYLERPISGEAEIKTGVSVPKKLIKTAVKRNRIKRLMREIFRKNKYLVYKDLSRTYSFMFIYISKEEIPYEKLEKSMQKLLEQIQKMNR